MVSTPVQQPSTRLDEPLSFNLPMESSVHEQQASMFAGCIRRLWKDKTDWFLAVNLTLFYFDKSGKRRWCGPDLFLVKGVESQDHNSWTIAPEEGTPPSWILELVSPSSKSRRKDKVDNKTLYQNLGVNEYFWFDIDVESSRRRLAGFRLVDGFYETIEPDERGYLWSEELGLFLGLQGRWLRLFTADGELVPTPIEAEEIAQQQSQQESDRAERERQGRLEAESRAAQLAARLQELGIDPDELG